MLEAECKSVFVIRDPRDALVSLVFYLELLRNNKRDFFWVNSEIYNSLSFDEKLAALMTGSCCTNYLEAFYKPIMKWCRSSCSLTIKFEDLIGPTGGGTKKKQFEAIKAIASYLNVTLSDEEVVAIGKYCVDPEKIQNTFGLSYKKSQTGSWKLYFNEANLELFHQVFSDEELIECGYGEE